METENSIVYGFHPVVEALRSGARGVRKVVLSSGRSDQKIKEVIALARQAGVQFESLPAQVFQKKYPEKAAQGIAAELESQCFVSFEELLAVPKKRGETPCFLILDEIEDPRNAGAILRTAESGGVHGALIPLHRSAGFGPALHKAAAGACEYLPLCRVSNIKQYMEKFQEAGITVVGSVTDHEVQPYWSIDFTQPLALVLGSEEKGLRHTVRQRCDLLTTIPMAGKIVSLNVSVAAGILIYEVMRQRQR
ncbi:MAG TPA: 23S rRNA (guanosine(2251)-2'-O)-methyltransferase RlmB [Thermodesulfovibrionia bacterium]|nr:23S rRNA (guanosine(2251)-2'-O)-methyltransferase RlmB [Thermodesulfovibrionia bacterium]